MYFYYIFFLVWVPAVCAGAVSKPTLAELAALVPKCGVQCILTTFPPSAYSQPKSICTNTTLLLSLSGCIQNTCNRTEQAVTATIAEEFCAEFPKESWSWPVAIWGIALAVIALTSVALRFYFRVTVAREVGVDDWLILGAAAAVTTISILDVYNCRRNGFGNHLWDVDPRHTEQILKIFYACEVLYLVAMVLIKSAILVFYLRIFQSSWFWAADITVLTLTIGTGLATSLACVFQCHPLSDIWNPAGSDSCINTNTLAIACGAMAVFFDVLVLLLPVPELIMLRMSMQKRIRILIMFSLGSLACITSICRLKYIVVFATSKDATYDNSYAVIWTLLEMTVAMVCACLPSIRGTLTKWFPKLFQDSTPSPSSKCSNSNGRTGPLGANLHLNKMGPSYNKWTADSQPPTSPLTEIFAFDKINKVAKAWVGPQQKDTSELVSVKSREILPGIVEDEIETKVEVEENGRGRRSQRAGERESRTSQVPTLSTNKSLWVLERPRISHRGSEERLTMTTTHEDTTESTTIRTDGRSERTRTLDSRNDDGDMDWDRDVEAIAAESGVVVKKLVSPPRAGKAR